ncbi:MAG: hypothetical protein K8I60_09415 [Anaerolineae bacterium]|nr:hypothetical protein [Anaerolineae bacterium]
MSAEQIGLWAGLILTLMIFSYLLGDNFLYRIAVYVFVGLAAGFITVVTVENVLLPWMNGTILASSADMGTRITGLVPLILGGMLLLKASPRLGRLGGIAVALMIGVGTAVALVGAVTGTLLPLAAATGSAVRVDVINGFLIFLGVTSTLIYFWYLARRTPAGGVRRGLVARVIGTVGQGVIVMTLGALYAAAILTSLTIFSERISFILARITGG